MLVQRIPRSIALDGKTDRHRSILSRVVQSSSVSSTKTIHFSIVAQMKHIFISKRRAYKITYFDINKAFHYFDSKGLHLNIPLMDNNNTINRYLNKYKANIRHIHFGKINHLIQKKLKCL